MNDSDEELGRRVARWRAERGLTQSGLAQMIGLDQSSLSRIESGQRRLSTTELADLAAALKIDPLELLEENPLSDVIVTAARVTSNEVDADVDAIRLAVEILRTWRSLATDAIAPKLGTRPRVRGLPTGDVAAGTRAAQRLRQLLDNLTRPISDLASTAANLGLAMVWRQFEGVFDGVCVTDFPRAVAIVNTNHWGSRQRFTAAHELGHWVLGDVDSGPCSDIDVLRPLNACERRANAFAAAFLLPDEIVRGIIDFDGAIRCGFEYGVSLPTLGWRIENVLHDSSLAARVRDIEAWKASELTGCGDSYERDRDARFREGMTFQLETAFRKAGESGAVSERRLAALLPSNEGPGKYQPLA